MDKNVNLVVALQHALAARLRPITEHLVYTTRSGIAAGLKRKGGLGFIPRQVSREEEFFVEIAPLLKGKTVYDIGSYEGVFSTFFARAIGPEGTLIVFEPNPVCQSRTTTNLQMNHFPVRLEAVGLGSRPGTLTLTFPAKEPARSTLDADIAGMIAQEGSSKVQYVTVRVERLDDIVKSKNLPAPDFLKVDTEGAELDIILGAEHTIRTYCPSIYIEMHGANLEQKMALQRQMHAVLQSWGYTIRDLDGLDVGGADHHAGHIFCTHPGVRSYVRVLEFDPEFGTAGGEIQTAA